MTDTEINVINTAFNNGPIVGKRELKVAKILFGDIRQFILYKDGEFLKAKFDPVFYMGKLPSGYLTGRQVDKL